MAEVKKYIAVDLGAESGRVMLGSVCDDRLELEEVHRFSNGPIEENNSLRWDFDRLFAEVKAGISKALKQAGAKVEGIGVDSWGVDFGLIGADGKLLENPYHYRDSRTNTMMEKAFELMSKREIYENTGIQFMQLNSIYQLLAMRLANSDVLAKTKKLIFMADLFSYYLCGKAFGEYTLASTSQLMDMKTGRWSEDIFNKLSLSIEIMPDIVQPGTIVGKLSKAIADELGCGQIPVIATASHDTASAVAAVPAGDNEWAYLSSGTWSLMGVEVSKAIVNDKTFEYEFTNEGGVENTIRLLKNIMGLWLVQECKRQWQRDGTELSYPELTKMAEKAQPFACYIEVDSREFLAPGDMPKRINNYLAATGQKQILDKGQMIRAILEGLAFKYRLVLERLEDVTGHKIDCLHIVGGGMQNELLNQFAANATGKRVVAGPAEATATGNILMQAKATGQIKNLAEARKIIRNSFELKEYQPQDVSLWQEQYESRHS
ncbi:MAG: rhamnulokinase family protein [Sedimentisphaerales bacterium]